MMCALFEVPAHLRSLCVYMCAQGLDMYEKLQHQQQHQLQLQLNGPKPLVNQSLLFMWQALANIFS